MLITLGDASVPFVPWKPRLGRVFDRPFAIDTETTLIDDDHPWITPAYILGAACDGTAGYFITREHIATFLKAHQGLPMAFHNAAFDLEVLQLVTGKQLDLYAAVDADLVWDTQLLHQLLCLGSEGHVAWGKGLSTLETCAQRYLATGLPKGTLDSAGDPVRPSYSKWLNQPPEAIEPVYLEYLAKDALATILVYDKVQSELAELLQNSQDAFNYQGPEWLQEQVQRWGPQTHHTQLKGAIVLRAITANGIRVDLSKVGDLRKALEAEQSQLLEALREHCYIPGEGSDKAVQKILERAARSNPDLMLPRTATGKFQVTEEALEPLRDLEPFVDLLLRYKEVNKLLKTYLDKLSKGVLHPSFRSLVESGRTSSFGEINAQNLPHKKEIRECLIASPGKVLISADYSTLELATLAQTAQDLLGRESEMGRLINEGVDLHSTLAGMISGLDPADVPRESRQKSKAINFGKPGGMSTNGLIRYAKASYGQVLTADEAKEWEEYWFDLFPEMNQYLQPWYEAGEELAYELNLIPAEYQASQDKTPRFDDDEATVPAGWLGGMCLKVLGEERPRTNQGTGREYTEVELDYFWGKLQENISLFPDEFHADIAKRKSSWKLRNGIRSWLTRCPVFTTTGRIRANAAHCQQKNTPFQGLAADGAKLALWKLWRSGKRIVNFIHDEIVIEADESLNLAAEAEELCQVMVDAMRQVVPDVRIAAEYSISRCWDKNQKLQLDKDGYPKAWELPIRSAA
jgi:DNA polymerase I-like protein with 3'-5' exonuclease and polymerase domains